MGLGAKPDSCIRTPRNERYWVTPNGGQDRTVCPGHGSFEDWSADKPLDPLGGLSLSQRRRPYLNHIVPAARPFDVPVHSMLE